MENIRNLIKNIVEASYENLEKNDEFKELEYKKMKLSKNLK